jgi:lipopolysaccharide/colanic/teichoic acid biosynthesis glycosyltransferase
MLRRFLPATRVGTHGLTLHSVERMRALLDRERMRSDRGNTYFSLLTLTFPRPYNHQDLAALGEPIYERIRATDDAGFLGPRCIGVLLPETPPKGAWQVADELCQRMPRSLDRPQCDVYTYPWDDDEQSGAEPADELPPVDSSDERPTQPMHLLFAKRLPGWKRALDILGAGTAIVLLGPLMLAVAAAIKLTSKGPIIFKQKRDTLGGRTFMIYKFRTMEVDAEAKKAALLELSEQDGPAFKIRKDPRITRIGGFLRKTSLDELPQFFNVLFGHMTLVGPRAMCSKESANCQRWQRRRLDVTAGITCIWQVRGRSQVSFAEWMRMDLSYVKTRSLAQDVKLIAQTVPAVLLRRGAC